MRDKRMVLVCGGRGWVDRLLIHEWLAELRREGYVRMVHGGCRGADQIAGEEAQLLGFQVRVVPARWDLYGKAAGVLRNSEMVSLRPDLVLAFHDNLKDSRGTAHMLRLARGYGIPTRVITRVQSELTLTFFAKKVSKETLHTGGAS